MNNEIRDIGIKNLGLYLSKIIKLNDLVLTLYIFLLNLSILIKYFRYD